MDSAWLHRLFAVDGRVRSGWRILLFGALFVLFSWVAAELVRVLAPQLLARPALSSGLVTLPAALAAAWLLLTRLDGRPAGALGFAITPRTPREVAAGFAITAASLGVAVGVLALAGWVAYHREPGTAAGYVSALFVDFLALGVAAAAEEALFRGYPFQALVQGIGPAAATILASAAFALAHWRNPNVGYFALVNIFLAGVLLSVAYLRTRSLWFATALHLGWNWTMASLLDLPVSGLELFDTPLYEPVTTGAVWITGGAFGPEGGAIATLAFGLALVAVVKLPEIGEAPALRKLRPLVDG